MKESKICRLALFTYVRTIAINMNDSLTQYNIIPREAPFESIVEKGANAGDW